MAPPKKAPKKKKSKKKKDSAFMTDEEREAEEEAKKKAEQERLERERLQKLMEEELRKAKKEKKKMDIKERQKEDFRNLLLKKHGTEFREVDEEHLNYLLEIRQDTEWQAYIACNHRPLVNDAPALNTFLYRWKMREDSVNMNNFLEEIEEMINTINPVEEYINNPLDMKEGNLRNLTEAKLNYYEYIFGTIDKVTFDAVRDIDKHYTRHNPDEAEIILNSKNVMFWLWTWSLECAPFVSDIKKERPSRKSPIMLVTLPGIMDEKKFHMRIVHSSFDPYSVLTESFHPPSFDGKDLYEETISIREMEVKALKERFLTGYDEDIMPWWFLIDEEVIAEKKRKELLKKGKKRKKSKELIVEVKEENKQQEVSHPEINDAEEESVEEEDVPLPAKPINTQILYSRSMTKLAVHSKKKYRGPEYFPEVDPINYLEESDAGKVPSEASEELDKEVFHTERHTTFRACVQTDVSEIDDHCDILKDVTKSFNPSDGSDDSVSFTDRRVFLDWRSLRDQSSPDREAIREDLEQLYFGDTEAALVNGKITCKKRDPHLRSIKELFKEIPRSETTVKVNTDPEAHKNVEEPKFRTESTQEIKISNITEMKELEMQISNILDLAWDDYSHNYVDKLMMSLDPSSINMRQYVIIGGVFQFDFFEYEPQPFTNNEQFRTQILYGERKLKRVLFDQLPLARIDLNAEYEKRVSEVKRQKMSLLKTSKLTTSSLVVTAEENDSSQTDDDLIWIVLKLPKNVLFFECPTPVRWNSDKQYWTKDDVYDKKWNQEKNTVQFKLGKSLPFAMAVNKFCNLPYFDFHLKPSLDWKHNPSVGLEIKTRSFTIVFLVKEDKVTVVSMDHEQSHEISHIIGKPYMIYDLIVSMRKCGVDIFPDWDSFVYVNVNLRKVKALEEHMCHCIGISSPAFEYKGSNFNSMSRDDKIYVELRECLAPSSAESPFQTLEASPRRVIFVTAGKGGSVKEDPINESLGYKPDLKCLVDTTASNKALRRISKASRITVATVINLITATKILSYT